VGLRQQDSWGPVIPVNNIHPTHTHTHTHTRMHARTHDWELPSQQGVLFVIIRSVAWKMVGEALYSPVCKKPHYAVQNLRPGGGSGHLPALTLSEFQGLSTALSSHTAASALCVIPFNGPYKNSTFSHGSNPVKTSHCQKGTLRHSPKWHGS
jgi:hypothetical protein